MKVFEVIKLDADATTTRPSAKQQDWLR